MTNREQICSQQIHCLSCPLSVAITGKDCRNLTQKELNQLKVREFENTCVCCGNAIPEGRQFCPICGQSEADHFEKTMSRKLEPEFKVDDVREQSFREGYTTGFNEGMKAACNIKQENEQLKRRIVILEQQANKTIYDLDGEYE